MQKTKSSLLPLLFITVLCCMDYQFFTEGYAQELEPIERQAGHITILAIIAITGYWGWKNRRPAWMRNTWLMIYAVCGITVMGIGLLNAAQPLPTVVLDNISTIRLFAGSPLPYCILYILSKTNPVTETEDKEPLFI